MILLSTINFLTKRNKNMFLAILEFVFVGCIVLLFLFQIITPLIQNKPFFPYFRKQEKELSEEYAETNKELEDLELQRKILENKKKIEEVKTEITQSFSDTKNEKTESTKTN